MDQPWYLWFWNAKNEFNSPRVHRLRFPESAQRFRKHIDNPVDFSARNVVGHHAKNGAHHRFDIYLFVIRAKMPAYLRQKILRRVVARRPGRQLPSFKIKAPDEHRE